MRYQKPLWDFFIRFTDEEDVLKDKKEAGHEDAKPFFMMEEVTFFRLLNTFRWLMKYSDRHTQSAQPTSKPTNADILEAVEYMRSSGNRLREHAKKHRQGELRNNLLKMAKKMLECAAYYQELIESDFFRNKEVPLAVYQEEAPDTASNEQE